MMMNQPKKSKVYWWLLIFLVIGSSLGYWVYCYYTSPRLEPVSKKVEEKPLTLYRDPDGWFETKYPKGYFRRLGGELGFPPDFKEVVKGNRLVRYLSGQECRADDTVPCGRDSEEMSVSLVVAERDFPAIWEKLKTAYQSRLSVVSLAGHQGVAFRTADKVNYIVVPIDGLRTLFLGYYQQEGSDGSAWEIIKKNFLFKD